MLDDKEPVTPSEIERISQCYTYCAKQKVNIGLWTWLPHAEWIRHREKMLKLIDAFYCKKCNIVVDSHNTHPAIPYSVIDGLYVRLIFTCEEIIIKNIIEW